MKQVMAVVLAAIVASLAACEIASKQGIRGIPDTLNMWLSGEKTAVVSATVPDAETLKEAAAAAKDKAADAIAKAKQAAEEAVEAAQPANKEKAEIETPSEPTAEAEAEAPAAAAAVATLSYFGASDKSDADQPWAAAATVYDNAAAAEPAPAEEATESEAAPAETGGVATLSYFAASDKPDADQPWAAAATVFEEVATSEPVAAAAEEATPEAAPAEATLSYFGASEKPDADQPWAVAATVFEVAAGEESAAAPAEEAAPAATGGEATLSYFGASEKSDAEQPWAAGASMNPDYSAAAPAPASEEEPAAAEEASAEHPPAEMGAPGATSFFGTAEKPDVEQPWAAGASMNSDYSAATPAPAAPSAAPSAEVEACQAKINETASVTFPLASWSIGRASYGALDKIARIARDCGAVVVEIEGHADNVGKESFNQKLSELRAKAVMRYLAGAGVEAAKMKAVGFGQDKPVADNDTVEGRRKNRRIEFTVMAP